MSDSIPGAFAFPISFYMGESGLLVDSKQMISLFPRIDVLPRRRGKRRLCENNAISFSARGLTLSIIY